MFKKKKNLAETLKLGTPKACYDSCISPKTNKQSTDIFGYRLVCGFNNSVIQSTFSSCLKLANETFTFRNRDKNLKKN